MPPQTATLLRYIRRLAVPEGVEPTDRELLQRFTATQDQAAFAALVHRHSRLVWGVCWNLLRQEQDAEDAFQATFLTLARRAPSIRKQASVASWLYGVALHVAGDARKSAERRRTRERRAAARVPDSPVTEAALSELQVMLHEEVERLPAKYRSAFVLCCLEGRSKAEAARELGTNEGTVSSRLARARDLLRKGLARRGVELTAALGFTALAPNAAPAGLIAAAVRVGLSGAVVPPAVAALVSGPAWIKTLLISLVLGVAVTSGFALAWHGDQTYRCIGMGIYTGSSFG